MIPNGSLDGFWMAQLFGGGGSGGKLSNVTYGTSLNTAPVNAKEGDIHVISTPLQDYEIINNDSAVNAVQGKLRVLYANEVVVANAKNGKLRLTTSDPVTNLVKLYDGEVIIYATPSVAKFNNGSRMSYVDAYYRTGNGWIKFSNYDYGFYVRAGATGTNGMFLNSNHIKQFNFTVYSGYSNSGLAVDTEYFVALGDNQILNIYGRFTGKLISSIALVEPSTPSYSLRHVQITNKFIVTYSQGSMSNSSWSWYPQIMEIFDKRTFKRLGEWAPSATSSTVHSIVCDEEDNLYLFGDSSSSHYKLKISASGEVTNTGKRPMPSASMSMARGVICKELDLLVVAAGTSTVNCYDRNADTSTVVKSINLSAYQSGSHSANAIQIDKQYIYIVTGNHIFVFNKNIEYVRHFPIGLTMYNRAAALSVEGTIMVADNTNNYRVLDVNNGNLLYSGKLSFETSSATITSIASHQDYSAQPNAW